MSLNIELLEQSFERIKPRASDFVATFYENLFTTQPEVKPLFAKIDMATQHKKLFNTLVLVVENLRNPEALGDVLNALGARHVGYGAIPKYYGAFIKALLLTFEQFLQQDWTPEVKKAWQDAFGVMTALMLKGASEQASSHVSKEVQLEIQAIPNKQVATVPATNSRQKLEDFADSQLKQLPVELLESSFHKIKPRTSEFVASFYENLFTSHPEVKPLFAKVDMATQHKKLLQALVLVVENLRDPEALGDVLNALGARHVGYGAIPKYYGAVSKALLSSFEQYLQQDWTPEVNKAWTDAFRAINALMLKGATQESSAKVVRDEKAATINKPSEIKAELNNESEQFQPQAEQQRKHLILILLDGEILKKIRVKITNTSQRFQPKLSVERWSETLKQIVRKSIDAFWILPVWLIATVSAVVMTVVFVFTDEKSLLGKALAGTNTASLVVALVLFIKEAPDRRKQFHYQAWSTVDAAHNVKVSYARIMALQDLNQDGVSLRGLDAPGAELVDINLPSSNLSAANLSETDLSNANLSHANLDNANLSQSKVSGANLSYANLSFARLSHVNFSSANLSSAKLLCADLSHANMSGVNLRNATLSGANLNGTYLTGANLKGAKVSLSELSGAFLEGAIMPDGSKHRSSEGVK
ncbi:pentapeptide repeat-containing protein [Brasilonema sp. CT11]|nr:pentapeptide repeat-containing protein [Brasilonema sp. CT11]